MNNLTRNIAAAGIVLNGILIICGIHVVLAIIFFVCSVFGWGLTFIKEMPK